MWPGRATDTEIPSVLKLQRHGRAPSLFCICGLYAYQPLADALSPEIPVYGMFLAAEHLPVEVQAARYVRALREIEPSGPYLLAGFSFGGVLAYEVAQQLVSDGEEVHKLTLLDSWLPSAVDHSGARSRLRRLRRMIGTPSPDRARDRTVTRVMAAYTVRPYAGAVRIVRATQSVAELGTALRDAGYGWRGYVSTLETLDLPGDHAGILRGESVRQLAAALGQDRATDQLESM